MQEMNEIEIDAVNGAGFWETVGYALGFATGAGAGMQKYVESMDNYMLGAMYLGA